MQLIYSTLIKELHQFAKTQKLGRAVIGLSGGLDSAVALCIAVRAFGPKNVTALILPELGLTPNDDIEHARMLAAHFGCVTHYQPINNFLVDFNFIPWEKSKQADENLKERIRSLLLKNYAESESALFLGTANKSDLMLGLGCHDGAFAGDIHILGDLHKSQITELAHFIGLPEELIEKAPARGLRANQYDESDLSGSWRVVDDILTQIHNTDPEALIEKGMDSLLVHKVVRMVQETQEQNSSPVVIPVGALSEQIKKAQAAEASSMRSQYISPSFNRLYATASSSASWSWS